ncbi:CoA pyrophosphatase [Mangrovimonas sp. AS39]|nr:MULTISPECIES: CoA pyrophosphatase [Mangrovimonas]MCF1192053.1 CoA pyrophosphatase [Mangrovimonas futianensis]MCF1195747.1 CoA pyrophosphatase [Mangrovimonas futianensis]MCF1422290.1 CoA pyrophosphatase [Mangrovimonas futianensis]NIK92792.1 CoA pyrophosphatase [Mangrovimonas sp. CR14]
MNFDRFINIVPKLKNIPLPAESSQFKMSPPFRQELIKREQKKMKFARKAGVMALFYPDVTNTTKLILILRKTYRGVHSAQVAFPGGKEEEHDDSLMATALRETAEEVGVPEHQIEVLREMTQVYIPPSNYYVYPFIGISKETPRFIKQETEVEELLEITFQDMISDSNVVTEIVNTSYQKAISVPAFKLNGKIVWGATAMMLSEIKDLLKQAL